MFPSGLLSWLYVPDVVKILMENAGRLSFDLSKKDSMGLTAFHFACLNGHSDRVQVFMEDAALFSIAATIALDVKDNKDWTPFHFA